MRRAGGRCTRRTASSLMRQIREYRRVLARAYVGEVAPELTWQRAVTAVCGADSMARVASLPVTRRFFGRRHPLFEKSRAHYQSTSQVSRPGLLLTYVEEDMFIDS